MFHAELVGLKGLHADVAGYLKAGYGALAAAGEVRNCAGGARNLQLELLVAGETAAAEAEAILGMGDDLEGWRDHVRALAADLECFRAAIVPAQAPPPTGR